MIIGVHQAVHRSAFLLLEDNLSDKSDNTACGTFITPVFQTVGVDKINLELQIMTCAPLCGLKLEKSVSGGFNLSQKAKKKLMVGVSAELRLSSPHQRH